jgi:predicted aminopeptidase
MQAKATSCALLLVTVVVTSGCYLGHVAAGQLRLLRASEPVEAVLRDPATSPELRRSLERVLEARAYAADLGLEVDAQYTSYADWPGDRVVTTLVATRPGEIEPAGFWFPLLGRLPYKGYFDPACAEAEAERLRRRHYDVCAVPVPAYSTLGWFDDPVTGPMLRAGEGALVETLVHELVHATVYLPGHADFDEGVAAFIGEEGSVRFYAERGQAQAAARRRLEVMEGRALDAEILTLRDRVARLYEELPAGSEREAARRRVEAEARAAIAALPLETREPASLSRELRLNDACLALAATYAADVPAYARRLEALGGDLRAFVARLRRAADAADPREALLRP